MTTTSASALAQDRPSDVYDPDEVFLPNSPMLKPYKPNLAPTPSPPPTVTLPTVSSSLRSGRKSSNRRHKVPPSQGDAVLIHYLGGGKRPEIAAEAGNQPLADYEDGDEDSCGDSISSDYSSDEPEKHTTSPPISPDPRSTESMAIPASRPAATAALPIDLKFLAAGAVAALTAQQPTPGEESQMTDAGGDSPETTQDEISPPAITSPPQQPQQPYQAQNVQQMQPVQQDQQHQPQQSPAVRIPPTKPVLAAPISPYPLYSPQDMYSPRQPVSQVLRHPSEVQSPVSVAHGELAPIQIATPRSESNGHVPLPSIRSTLGEQLHEQPKLVEKELTMRHPQTPFPHSPPGAPRMMIHPGSHASPPISPNYSQSMPSPAQSLPMLSPYAFYSSASSSNHPSVRADYSSSNTETPISEPASTPATSTSISDRMSIDHMTNQPLGSFLCTFQGCNAPPFQTQYLLNSHANVHSSARPHYCSVKGCARSEGGKGFKRKNEMIRHGLVHESPGYVCPFCPDREHKYPRPDNLQRHVRVHHVDKDKDDPLLRDVLSQRPDGPNRGRRRRGGP